jgi:hypothetical protein
MGLIRVMLLHGIPQLELMTYYGGLYITRHYLQVMSAEGSLRASACPISFGSPLLGSTRSDRG